MYNENDFVEMIKDNFIQSIDLKVESYKNDVVFWEENGVIQEFMGPILVDEMENYAAFVKEKIERKFDGVEKGNLKLEEVKNSKFFFS